MNVSLISRGLVAQGILTELVHASVSMEAVNQMLMPMMPGVFFDAQELGEFEGIVEAIDHSLHTLSVQVEKRLQAINELQASLLPQLILDIPAIQQKEQEIAQRAKDDLDDVSTEEASTTPQL